MSATLTPEAPQTLDPEPTPESSDRRSGWGERVRRFAREQLPTGKGLSDESFHARHRLALVTIAILVVILAIVGFANNGDADHLVIDLLPVVIPALIAARSNNRLVMTLTSAWALMASSSVLVHLTDGLIESHFLFFVLLPLVALYQDWRAFLGSIGFVLVSHGVVGTLAPESMYNHYAAINDPVKWALIHAVFVAALVVILVVDWNFAENEQRRTEDALRDLQSTQTQLLAAQKMESVGQLAAGVAHEINTPIQYVSDNTSFLAESFTELTTALDDLAEIARRHDAHAVDAYLEEADLEFLREEIPGALDQSKDGLGRVTEIVKAMKDFSHPGTEIAETDLNKAIDSTVTVSRNEWKYVAEMDLDLDVALPPVWCNEGQIKQVVLNMVVNAAHAIADVIANGEKGRITVTTRTVDDHVRISIADTGSGMPPEIRERIFDQFFTTKEVGKGTGQGLAMAYDIIVNSHKGTISVDSEVGRGTTFVLEIPLSGPPAD